MAAEDVQITCKFLTKLPAAYKVPDTAVVCLACVAAYSLWRLKSCCCHLPFPKYIPVRTIPAIHSIHHTETADCFADGTCQAHAVWPVSSRQPPPGAGCGPGHWQGAICACSTGAFFVLGRLHIDVQCQRRRETYMELKYRSCWGFCLPFGKYITRRNSYHAAHTDSERCLQTRPRHLTSW